MNDCVVNMMPISTLPIILVLTRTKLEYVMDRYLFMNKLHILVAC